MSYIYLGTGKEGYLNYRRVRTKAEAEEWQAINFTDKIYEAYYHEKPHQEILEDTTATQGAVLLVLSKHVYQASWLMGGRKEEPMTFAKRVYAMEEHHRYTPEFFTFFHDHLPF